MIASREHGIIDLDTMIDAGVPPSTIRAWARRGHLHRLHDRVYSVIPPALLTQEGRWLAAVKSCGPDAVLSHGSASQLHGLIPRRARLALHVSLTSRRRIRPVGIVVHRPRRLEARDLTHRLRIPTTSATRTLFDQAGIAARRELREQFEQAEHLERLDRARLRELLDNATGRRGLGYLRELAGYTPLPLSRTRSKLERICLSLCRTHSLPVPAVNVILLDYEVDLLWPDARFVVEADGGGHRGPQRDRDNERDLALQRAGYLVRRYSGEALADERAVAAEILAILRERLPA